MVQLFDAVTLGDTRMTRAGYMVADAKIARTGIMTYLGRELGRPDLDRVRVYRSDEEVFSEDSLASFAHAPITDDHPPVLVDATNWKLYSRGQTGNEVLRDGQFVRIPMMISDASAIEAVRGGKRELSAGYTCDIDFTAGITADGEAFDAVMTAIKGNHIALVTKGRAGSECRVGDTENPGANMKTVILDGVAVETTDEGAAAIVSMQSALAEAVKRVSAKDGEIDGLKATHLAELAAANAKVMDAAALDAAIASRTAVIDAARTILGAAFDVAGKSDADIRRAAVTLKLGDKVAAKDDAYIGAAFDTLTATAVVADADPARAAIIANAPVKDALSAYDKHVLWMQSAHLTLNAKDA